MKVAINTSKARSRSKFPALYRAKFDYPNIPSFIVLATDEREGMIVAADPNAPHSVGRVHNNFARFDNSTEWEFLGYVESINVTLKS